MEASDRGFPRVVVLMPFGDEFNQIYNNLILPALDGCEVERAGNLTAQHNVLGYIIQSVADADLVVADLTGLYPFVLYELGIAHALAKPSILLTQNVDELPFDLRSRMVAYSTYFADADHLRHTLRSTVNALVEGSLVEYSNPVMDFVPSLFNGQATYPQTATLERLLNVVSARLEMARMAEVEAADVVVEEAEVVEEEPVEEVIDEVIVVEEPVEEVVDEVIVVDEAPVAEEMPVEAAEETDTEAVEEAYDEVEEAAEAVEDSMVDEAAEEEAVAEAVEAVYGEEEEAAEAVEGDIVEEAVAEEEMVAEASETAYDEVEEAAEAVEDSAVDEAAEEEAVAEAVEAVYGEEEAAEAVEGDIVEEAVAEEEMVAEASETAYDEVEEAGEETPVTESPDEPRGTVPDKVLFTPFAPADSGDEVDDEEPVAEADDVVEAEVSAASGNGYSEPAEAEAEAEAAAETHGIAAAGLDAEEAAEETSVEEAPTDSEADAELVDESASYEDVGDAVSKMGEEASVIELGAGETVIEAETSTESEDELDGEEPESDGQDTSPWAY